MPKKTKGVAKRAPGRGKRAKGRSITPHRPIIPPIPSDAPVAKPSPSAQHVEVTKLPRTVVQAVPDYRYVIADIRRIGITAGVMLTILAALAFLLR